MDTSGMIDAVCRVCNKTPIKIGSTSKSGVCSICVLSGRLVPEKSEDVVATEVVETTVPAVEDTKVEAVKSEPTETKLSKDSTDVVVSIESTCGKSPKSNKPKVTKHVKNPEYGKKTARISELLKSTVKTKDIVSVMVKEFPNDSLVSMRNLVYVLRYRNARKK